jgi:hypothetical protein
VTSFGIGLLALVCVFGGALTGMFVARRLPPHHLGEETKTVLTLASGTLSVLSALVIGLLISYAKGDFDAQTKTVQKFAADLILLDRVMLQYGGNRAHESAAIFLILEMDRPFEGFIVVFPEPMQTALAHMGS